jgi:hypothetical protein
MMDVRGEGFAFHPIPNEDMTTLTLEEHDEIQICEI